MIRKFQYLPKALFGLLLGFVARRAYHMARGATDNVRANRERLTLALTAAQMGIWEWDFQKSLFFWSEQTFRICGFPISGWPWNLPFEGGALTRVLREDEIERARKLAYEEDVPALQEKVHDAIRKNSEFTSEFRIRRPDGAVRWLIVIGRSSIDESSQTRRISGVVADITSRKENEEALRRALKEVTDFKFALDNSSIVAVTDARGKISFVNDKFCEISKYDRSELIGQDHRIINSGFHPKEFFRDLWRTISSGKVWSGDIKNKAKDGTYYWVSTFIVPFLGEKNKPYQYLAIRTDITQKKIAEEALQHAIKARDEFISIASHELKTPITSMKMQTQLVARRIRREGISEVGPSVIEKMIETSSKQLDRLSRLVDDMLDISRIATGRFSLEYSDVNVSNLLMELVERFKPHCESIGCEISIDVDPTIRGCWDQFRIEQVITNLISNAIKYGEGKPISVSARKEGEWIEISVEDHGMGIPFEHQDRIFGRFERAVPATAISGLGLGLYIVKEILRIHGGAIRVQSAVGHGSLFSVRLPINPPNASDGRIAS